jgi:hypothetical protein
MKSSLLTGAVVAAALASAASAESLKKVPATLNPAKAYVLVEYKLQKNPYAGFPGSRKTMPLQFGLALARYDPGLGDVRGMGKAASKPVPTGQLAAESFRNKPLAKGEDSRLFLLELEPDTWVVQGYGDTSFSLGSYSFTLAPGTVTDLGIVSAERDWAEGQKPPGVGSLIGAAFAGPFAKSPDIAPLRATFRPRASGDMAVPAGLPIDRVHPVSFTPGATFGNYLGGLVNRIEGVNAKLRSAGAPASIAPPAAQPAAASDGVSTSR